VCVCARARLCVWDMRERACVCVILVIMQPVEMGLADQNPCGPCKEANSLFFSVSEVEWKSVFDVAI